MTFGAKLGRFNLLRMYSESDKTALQVTEAPHNSEFLRVGGEDTFVPLHQGPRHVRPDVRGAYYKES